MVQGTKKELWERGSITVISLMVLVVLTLLGLSVTRTATTDIQIAANEIPYKQNFYLAEGGLHREAAELGRGSYPVRDINRFGDHLADQDNSDLPGPPHDVMGEGYDFSIEYKGFYLPPTGYSIIHFNRYDYFVDVKAGTVDVASRYYKIGPKAQ